MNKIIPTILVQDRLEFVRRLGIIEGKIPMAQMDIMDGEFVLNTTFTDPKIAAHYKVDYELDLMVENPGPIIEKWYNTLALSHKGRGGKVVRAYVHVEIKKPLVPLLKKIRSYGWEAGLAINPDTPWEMVKLYLAPHPPLSRGERVAGGRVRGGETVDCILFMTVYPGQNAAPFQPKVVPKIAQFHKAYPDVPIAVDGGVNAATLPALLKAGVIRFAVGSAIWSAPDPIQAYKKLLNITNNSLI